MKFYVGDKMSGMYIKGQIVKEYRDNGNIITLNKVRHILREKEEGSDFVWNVESKLDKKIRLRECKDGWYLYLPEPNVKIEIKQKPLVGDVCVFETEIFEKLGYDIDLTALMENDTVENLAAYIRHIMLSRFLCLSF